MVVNLCFDVFRILSQNWRGKMLNILTRLGDMVMVSLWVSYIA